MPRPADGERADYGAAGEISSVRPRLRRVTGAFKSRLLLKLSRHSQGEQRLWLAIHDRMATLPDFRTALAKLVL